MLTSNLMFSIVIPSKNEERDIPTLLQSIKDQTLQPDRVIVSDKSTDNTRAIARSFGAMVVEGQDDGLIGKARNKGAHNAIGDFIIFLDADVELSSVTFLEDLITCMESLELDIASCYFNPHVRNIKSLLVFAGINLFKRLDSIILHGFTISGACTIVKTSVFEKVGGFREDILISEDIEFGVRTRKSGFNYKVLPLWITVSSRRFTEQSVSATLRSIIGGLGSIGAHVFHFGWFLEKVQNFEKLYGQTGGGWVNDKIKKIGNRIVNNPQDRSMTAPTTTRGSTDKTKT